MKQSERIQLLERKVSELQSENSQLRDELFAVCTGMKSKREDIYTASKVEEDFELPEYCRGGDIVKLKQLIYMLIFAETTYKMGPDTRGYNVTRIRADNMSDKQFYFYQKVMSKVYDVLLKYRGYAIKDGLNVWDTNDYRNPGTLQLAISKGLLKHGYIHKGESVPRKD